MIRVSGFCFVDKADNRLGTISSYPPKGFAPMSYKTIRAALALLAVLTLAGSRKAGAQNLVVNGDFSAGNTGFLYGYKYVEPVADALIPAGVFTVAGNTHRPFLLNSAGAKMTDYFGPHYRR